MIRIMIAALLLLAGPARAYVGPGAGFALVTSFLVVFAAVGLAGLYLAAWPFRALIALLRGRRAYARARVRRVVVVGLDGLDAGWCRRLLAAGELPSLGRLHFKPLATTLPAMSPVAWSTFQTGLDPSFHGIFDFLRPGRPGYRAELSSVVLAPPRRCLRLGRWRLPLGRPAVRLKRAGEPFWALLGRRGIFGAVLRVPITFPMERFYGVGLSGMCVPDLKGTQGTFTLFTAGADGPARGEGGIRVAVRVEEGRVEAELAGPPDPYAADGRPLRAPFSARFDGAPEVRLGRRRAALPAGRHTEWLPVSFRTALGPRVGGLVRFCLVSPPPDLRLYASPIQIDPARPALPLSQPPAYAPYLAGRIGPFATLGLAEDTWALNSGAYGREQFLEGVWSIHGEREAMLMDALDRVKRGLVCCVFDASDRIQHMFLDAGPEGAEVVRGAYRRLDELVGRVAARLGPDDVLVVLSDHGFVPFRRGVNLNAWLAREGFLSLEGEGGEGFAGVDWERTRAYALGLAGIYLNRRGREGRGILAPGEARTVAAAIRERLLALRDPDDPAATPVRRVFLAEEAYTGPYRDEAPDLMVGWGEGYRISWEGALGDARGEVILENPRPWGGDHCVDPELVPGVLFSSLPVGVDDPGLADLAPSVLDLFGVPAPPRWRGRPLFAEARP